LRNVIVRRVGIVIAGASFSCGVAVRGQETIGGSRIDELAAATSLDRAGIAPWHSRMTFELFDLDGKPGESGTIEEWWISSTRHRVVIASPSFHEILPESPDQVPVLTRKAYLVDLLVNETVHPVSTFTDSAHFVMTESTRKFAGMSLSCMVWTAPGRLGQQYCQDPGSKDLRVVLKNADRSLVRNSLASFMGTGIARDETITFGALTAIKGHIDLIEGTDLEKASLAIGPENDVKQPVLTPTRRTNFVQPRYPAEESAALTGGVVVLRGLILKDGHTGSLEVIASSGPKFSQSALDAIRVWRYSPMLLDGIPSEVDCTITILFLAQTSGQPRQVFVTTNEMDPEAR
jgi:TonB family protein